MINRGGEKIAPHEIDQVLLSHPAVAEAVAFGVADAKYGEEVHAAVVLKSAVLNVEEVLGAHCRRSLAPFKCPKVFHVTERIPQTATGKVQRRVVAEYFEKMRSKI